MRWFNSFVALENKFFREMKAAHKEIEKEIINNLEKLKVDEEGVLDLGRHKVGIDDLVDAENSVDAIEEIGWEMISDIFETAGERASKEVRDFVSGKDETKKAVTTNFDYSFNINSPEAIKYIDSRSVEFARESMDTILQSLRTKWNAHLKTGIGSRVTVGELTEKIQEIFRGTERETWSRARLIARTETVGAANQASMMAYNDAGVPRKMWVSSRDPLVRDSHEKMDGVIVNSSENFVVNGKPMNGPGDPKGGPAETCNCRCTLIPIFEEEAGVPGATSVGQPSIPSEEERVRGHSTASLGQEELVDLLAEDYKKAGTKLTRNAAVKLSEYLKDFSGTGFKDMRNAQLGRKKSFPNLKKFNEYLDKAKNIEDWVDKAPQFRRDKTLYRGLINKREVFENVKEGMTYHSKALSSWSSKKNIALDYARTEEDVLLILKKGGKYKGVSLSRFSSNPHEAEVLLSGKNKFKIISKKIDSSGIMRIELEFIGA